MTGSLRALLAGSIDYAGMFPPAGLPLARAIDEYRRHRAGSDSWMLGRFVVPAAKLAELAETWQLERDGRLTVIVSAGDSRESSLKHLDAALTGVAGFPVGGAVDTLELRWPAESLRGSDAARLANLVQAAADRIAASGIGPVTMFFELPRDDTPSADWAGDEIVRSAVAALVGYNRTARALPGVAGFKLRCGGANASGIPSPAEVASVICECRDQGVFWKATAGLHHPLRHIDSQAHIPTHGFLNLLVAAVAADVHRLDKGRTQAIVETVDAGQFGFSDDAFRWGELPVAATQIAAARERSLRSFGSCSFDEPRDDLRSLGWL